MIEKDGALVYADPEQAQVAVTGKGAVTPIGVNTWEAQFSDARPIEVRDFNVAGESNFVKPLNPYLLTAYNARSTIQPDEVNDRAHVQLAAKLQELGPQAIEGSGSEEGTDLAAEECYFALGLALEPAKAMSTHFNQDAIVWVGADAEPQLILLR